MKPQFTKEQLRQLIKDCIVVNVSDMEEEDIIKDAVCEGYIITTKVELHPLKKGDIVIIKATGKEAIVQSDDCKYKVVIDGHLTYWYTREELELKDDSGVIVSG